MACVKQVEEEVSEADAYANEPQRHPALKVHTQTPFNAETPLHIIESQDVTPVEMHFKRHHLPVPLVEVRKDRGRGVAFRRRQRPFARHGVPRLLSAVG